MLRSAFAAALAFAASAAAASDLQQPASAPPPELFSPAPAAFNWSGFLFGAHGGYGLGSGDHDDGAVVGGQLGVAWQYGRFVVGIEGDADWVDWADANVAWSMRGRGGLAYGRLHAYGTAGIAIRGIKALTGWVAGAGLEYAVTDSLAVGVEYLHYDFVGDDSEVFRGRLSYMLGDFGAGDPQELSHAGIFDEVRLGGFAFVQEVAGSEEGAYATAQVFFDPFVRPFENPFLDVLLRPRPHIGGTVSPFGTDQLFAGLTWTAPLGRLVFVEASFGGTVHNGPIKGAEVSLGCHPLFRESVGIGANVGEHWRVIASVDHSTNYGLCSNINDGLTHAGASVGYRF